MFWKRIFTGVDCLVFSPRNALFDYKNDFTFPDTSPTDILFDIVHIIKFEVKFYPMKILCFGEGFCQQKLANFVMVKKTFLQLKGIEGHKGHLRFTQQD